MLGRSRGNCVVGTLQEAYGQLPCNAKVFSYVQASDENYTDPGGGEDNKELLTGPALAGEG